MLGIDYASSDEEEEVPATKSELTNIATANAPPTKYASKHTPLEETPTVSGPINGPSQGPTVSPPPTDAGQSEDGPPGSPYTSNRALIQNLTLPAVPNFDIPASPPGSPPLQATKRFTQFLELKKKGQHFNQRLEGSSVLRDPGHLRKLLDFAGISEEDSYTSTLSEDVAVPAVFPDWAYVEELRASQKKVVKAKEQQKPKAPREAVEFVSTTKSGTSSGTGTPSGKVSRQNAGERGIAGFDKDLSIASSSQGTSKRKQLEHRGREETASSGGWRSRSRSPKRKRSRSREKVR